MISNNAILKSNIQLTLENQQLLHSLKEYVRRFVESYDTDNMIIGLNGKTPMELNKGFFIVEKSFDNLDEALNYIQSQFQAIQLLGREENRTFNVGVVSKTFITSLNENHEVINISTLKKIL